MSLENYGNYQLLKRLATGGMAQIYLARSRGPKASNQLVVVKRILPHLGENKEFVQMFLDEAKIAARLAHPNIVAIYDLGAQDDSFFIAMEYIHGEDVRRMCKRAGGMGMELPVPLACRIIIDACAGLDYAHKKTDGGKPLNIVHRDVSPQNILVSFKGEVKVVDFGIAKAADQATVTRSGVLKGKYSYMSPEQASAKKVDCRSDVFALGVVLYELLTSTRLFKRSNDMQTLAAVAECNVIPPSQVNPRVPADLDPIVLKALAKEPEARYAEALLLQQDLEAWLRTRKLSATNAELAAFLRQVYEERLAREARSGSIVVEEDPPPTGQRTAVEGNRRGSGANPSVSGGGSSRDVTKAERGDQKAAAAAAAEDAVELTDPVVLRPPQKPARSGDMRRETVEERMRPERQTPAPRLTVEERRPNLSELPTQALDEKSLAALSVADTQSHSESPPRRSRWRGRLIIAGVAATVSAVAAALGMWFYLRPLLERPVPALPPATIRLETVPPGAKVMLEGGKQVPGVTPLTLPPLAAGTHEVVITREGYEEVRIPVAVPATGSLTMAPVSLRPLGSKEEPAVTPPPDTPAIAAVQLTLQTEPVQATIFVDGKERGLSPQVLEAKADQELEVKVTAPQYRPLEQKVKVKSGPSQVEVLKLEPLPKPPPTVKQTRVVEQPKPPPPSAKALVRFVVLPANSWVEVTCSGRSYGQTPFGDVSLPVGTHSCRFSNPGEGRTFSQTIEVRAAALNKVIVNLRDGTVKFSP